MGRRCTTKKIKCGRVNCLNVICLKCHPTMRLTDTSFMQIKKNNSPFNYICDAPCDHNVIPVVGLLCNKGPSI